MENRLVSGLRNFLSDVAEPNDNYVETLEPCFNFVIKDSSKPLKNLTHGKLLMKMVLIMQCVIIIDTIAVPYNAYHGTKRWKINSIHLILHSNMFFKNPFYQCSRQNEMEGKCHQSEDGQFGLPASSNIQTSCYNTFANAFQVGWNFPGDADDNCFRKRMINDRLQSVFGNESYANSSATWSWLNDCNTVYKYFVLISYINHVYKYIQSCTHFK